MNKKSKQSDAPDSDKAIEKLLQNFEPETDPLDRRILYEVTKMRLNQDEFKDQSDSSDSSQEPPDDDENTDIEGLSKPRLSGVRLMSSVNIAGESDEEDSV